MSSVRQQNLSVGLGPPFEEHVAWKHLRQNHTTLHCSLAIEPTISHISRLAFENDLSVGRGVWFQEYSCEPLLDSL